MFAKYKKEKRNKMFELKIIVGHELHELDNELRELNENYKVSIGVF